MIEIIAWIIILLIAGFLPGIIVGRVYQAEKDNEEMKKFSCPICGWNPNDGQARNWKCNSCGGLNILLNEGHCFWCGKEAANNLNPGQAGKE